MIATLLCFLAMAQQSDQKAAQLLADMPEQYAKLSGFEMKVKLTGTVGDQVGIVQTQVVALKPNLFTIEQTSQTATGAQRRKFVCDGKTLALPEPRHPERFLADPEVPAQWAGSMRTFGSLMLDNGWPLGVVFRAKQETHEFLNHLRNLKVAGTIELADGEANVITGEVWEFQGSVNGRPEETKAFDIELTIGADGTLRKMVLRADQIVQRTALPAEGPNPGKRVKDDVIRPVRVPTTMVWDIELVKGTKATKETFKLPPLRRAQGG